MDTKTLGALGFLVACCLIVYALIQKGRVTEVKWPGGGGAKITYSEDKQPPAPSTDYGKPEPPTPKAPPEPAPPTLTSETVQGLLSRWQAAQNSGDFTTYRSCYSNDFTGIKRTTGGRVTTYNYSGWMSNRQTMIEETVDVDNVDIRVHDNTAVVQFHQYYRSPGYSDQGPKVMKVESTPDSPKIYYEEMKASYRL